MESTVTITVPATKVQPIDIIKALNIAKAVEGESIVIHSADGQLSAAVCYLREHEYFIWNITDHEGYDHNGCDTGLATTEILTKFFIGE